MSNSRASYIRRLPRSISQSTNSALPPWNVCCANPPIRTVHRRSTACSKSASLKGSRAHPYSTPARQTEYLPHFDPSWRLVAEVVERSKRLRHLAGSAAWRTRWGRLSAWRAARSSPASLPTVFGRRQGGPRVTASPLRWRMIALAFFATVINYLDRQTLSVAAPLLREQFHMSNEVYSRVVTAFLFAYTIMNGGSGPLIDRLGTRLGYGLCVLWWSAAAALHALARGPLSLGAFRFLLGIGEAGNWPAAIKLVAEWFPEKERALACGVFNSGSSIGAILAPPLVAFLILQIGWQSAFGFVGLAGMLWLIAWFAIYYTPKAVSGLPSQPTLPVRKLLRMPFVRAFTISKIFMDPVWY